MRFKENNQRKYGSPCSDNVRGQGKAETHPDLAKLELVVSSSRIKARGDSSRLAAIMVILKGIVNRVGIALAQVESRIEKALAGVDGESRNNAEELHTQK